MSHEATAWAWKLFAVHPELAATRRMVLLALAESHNKTTSQCNPSITRLREMTGLKVHTIHQSIRELEALGLLVADRMLGKGSSYQLTVGVSEITSAENGTSAEMDTSAENGIPPVPKTAYKPGKNQERKDISPLIPQTDVNELFTRFWAAYPKKLSKGQAERTFAQLKPNEQLLAEILLGLQRAKTSDQRFIGGEYIPHASTWLNAKGWQDEHDQEIPKPATSSAYGQAQGVQRGSPRQSVEQQNREAAKRAKELLFGNKENVIEGVFSRERA